MQLDTSSHTKFETFRDIYHSNKVALFMQPLYVWILAAIQKPGLDPINKKLQKIFRKSGQIFCFQEIPTDFQIFIL